MPGPNSSLRSKRASSLSTGTEKGSCSSTCPSTCSCYLEHRSPQPHFPSAGDSGPVKTLGQAVLPAKPSLADPRHPQVRDTVVLGLPLSQGSFPYPASVSLPPEVLGPTLGPFPLQMPPRPWHLTHQVNAGWVG